MLDTPQNYRLDRAILAMARGKPGNPHTEVRIPTGALITMDTVISRNSKLVSVIYEGQALLIFAIDLAERSTLMPPPNDLAPAA